jgi:hypothetical protein
MGIVTVPTFGADPVTITGPSLDAKVDGLATEFNGNIDNDNIDSAAAIANSKLNLASISQNVSFAGTVALTGVNTISGVTSMSGKIFKLAKGADVASVAGAITLGDDGNYFDITGTEAITSITAKTAGTVVVLQFDSTASLVDGSNLKLQGNFQGATDAQITLSSDGTNWFEVSRNTAPTVPVAASQAEMEAASSNTVFATPGRTQNHPGVAKAWCNFDGTDTGTNAPTTGYNVTSVTRNGTGDYTITFTTAFSSANYALMGMGKLDTGGDCIISISNLLAGSAQVICADDGGTVHDCIVATFTFFGDQ